MRISVLRDDPGRANLVSILKTKSIRVFLDGDQIRSDVVVTADDAEGFVVVYVLDDKFRLQYPNNSLRPAMKKLVGQVRIKTG